MSCWRLLLGLASGLCTCGDLCPLHQDGGCLFSVTHHLTLQLMYSRRSRCGHLRHTADMQAVFDEVEQYYDGYVHIVHNIFGEGPYSSLLLVET